MREKAAVLTTTDHYIGRRGSGEGESNSTNDDYLVENDKFLAGVPEYAPTFFEKIK